MRTMVPPTTKNELQQLIGRIEPFMELVKIKTNEEFRWGGRTATGI
jgi:hypothetical protein